MKITTQETLYVTGSPDQRIQYVLTVISSKLKEKIFFERKPCTKVLRAAVSPDLLISILTKMRQIL